MTTLPDLARCIFYLPGVGLMGVERKKSDSSDLDWEMAQAALAAAQAMPSGSARIEALKRAGGMRFAVSAKLVSVLAVPQTKDLPAKKNPNQQLFPTRLTK